jgi:hypothetical protein
MKTRKSIPRWLRRAPWERGTASLIGLGLAMLMQPWSMEAYSYSFIVLLAGVVGYSIAVKLPEQRGIGSFSRLREKAGDEGVSRPAGPHPNPLPQAGEGVRPHRSGWHE